MKSLIKLIVSLFAFLASMVTVDQYCRDNYNTTIKELLTGESKQDDDKKTPASADKTDETKGKRGSKATAYAGSAPKSDDVSVGGSVPSSPDSEKTTITFVNGDRYVGPFKNSKMSGHGEYTWANGDRYVGDYQDGKRHGKGTKTWTRGDRYKGEWKNDQITGHGEYVWANGNRYVGEFYNGSPNGYGKMTYRDGKQFTGNWENGKFVEP